MTTARFAALGAEGIGAAALTMLAATALGVAASGAMPQPWLPLAGGGLGVAAGLLGLLAVARRGGRHALEASPVSAPVAQPAAAGPGREMIDNLALLMHGMVEEMMRLKRDSAEASRGMAEARQAGSRIVAAADAVIARMDESAESSAIAARALALLPGIADNHAQRIELMAARAEQALAQVPEALGDGAAGGGLHEMLHALPERIAARLGDMPAPDLAELQATLARLEAMPAADTAALEGAITRLEAIPVPREAIADADLSPLHAAIARLEAISAADPAPFAALLSRLEALPSADHAPLAAAIARLDSLPGEIGTALAQQHPAEAARLDATLARLEAAKADPMLALGVMEATERLESIGADLKRALSLTSSLGAGMASPLVEHDLTGLATLLAPLLSEGLAADLTVLTERVEGAGEAIRQLAATMPAEPAQGLRAAVAEAMAGIGPGIEETAGRMTAAADRMAALSETLPEAVTQGIRAATPALDATADRVEAATQRMMALGHALPEAVTQGIRAATPALDATAGRIEAAALSMLALSEAMPGVVAGGLEQALGAREAVLAPRIEQAANWLEQQAQGIAAEHAALAETLAAGVEARLGAVAEGLERAARGFPPAAEGLAAHLAALDTLGPVLDGVTDRLIETADALAATGGSLSPLADAARRAMDALAVVAQNRPAATAVEVPTIPSVAASILGRLAPQEEPAMATALMRLDGVGREVAALLRDAEGLAGGGGLSRPAASRAPELLESLDETIRGLQSISTAIAMAADRRPDYARAG